ncbi:MAG: hypothetical protein E7370_05440 [Clostridiales bacterium]|nr:hypothetical protein [Clostridiales bacterium]
MEEKNSQNHSIIIEQCKKISATAIERVEGFSAQQIILSYSNGKIFISGNNLKIINFSSSTGAFSATGEIFAVKYGVKGAKFMQKIFK